MQRGGESPLLAAAGPARLPKLGESFLTREKDAAGSSKVFPSQNVPSLTGTEYLRLKICKATECVPLLLKCVLSISKHNPEHDQRFPLVVAKMCSAGNEKTRMKSPFCTKKKKN